MKQIKNRLQFKKTIGLILSLYFVSLSQISAQEPERFNTSNQGELIQFSQIKGASWESGKRKADSIARILNIPVSYLDKNGRTITLQRLEGNNKPVYYATDNIDAAKLISADKVWTDDYENSFLTGAGVDINIWDGGAVLTEHQEFENGADSRVTMRNLNIPLSNHSTHIAGTMAASGIDENARGMAGSALIFGWDFDNDLAEMAFAASEGILISNHSYGPLCGWYYNTQTEEWYWYGDPGISSVEDYKFGLYDQVSADLDYIAWCAQNYLIVKSAGNDRNDAPEDQPVEHYVWDDTWITVTASRDSDGGENEYDCLTPMAVSKNILTVGAVDDTKLMTTFSAFGPTDDGRIKPDIVANGKDVYSSIASSHDDYGTFDGTSMAAASASGSIALLQHLQSMLQPGVNLLSSSVKGVLIHTAEESGSSPGPDYSHGWGILNIKAASDLIMTNATNGGRNIIEGVITEGEIISISIGIPEATPFHKLTLCWTDPAGQASSSSLNKRDKKLINDLDIEIESSSSLQTYYPWVLDVENPELPATQGENHIDNVEQIYFENPTAGVYNIKISHSGALSGGSQRFSLILSGIEAPSNIYAPQNLSSIANPLNIQLKWNPPETGFPDSYNIYRDSTLLAVTIDTFYTDLSVVTDSTYNYYITAVYDFDNSDIESLGTNLITATPRNFIALPIIVDFEEETTEMFIKNNTTGWRWGDNESLSSYYLNFEENITKFIGTDSYTYGRISHIHDIAFTLPLKIEEYSDVSLSFDYMLVTGIYDAIDELQVVYKLQENEDWIELTSLPKASNWTPYALDIPEQAYKNGVQLGFYYDDLYQWGMGAGIDNINISGTPLRLIDLTIESLISPVSSCSILDDEDVIISIRNCGSKLVLPGDSVNVTMTISQGLIIEDLIVFTDTLDINEVFSYKMSYRATLPNPGEYTFDFVISSNIDHNQLNNTFTSSVEIYGIPSPIILNQDLTFCQNDPPVLIQVSPSGGTLSGTGVSGMYFDPDVAGAGSHTLTYTFIDQYGCVGSVMRQAIIFENPIVDLGSDVTISMDDTIIIKPEGNGSTFLWYDGSTSDSLIIIGENFNTGNYYIWVQAASTELCYMKDSIVLTVDFPTEIITVDPESVKVYPNPFRNGFYLKLNEDEILESITLYGQIGQVYLNHKPATFPYFNMSQLAPGSYILKIKTDKRSIIQSIIKL